MKPAEAMKAHNIEITSEFVPFSQSRNKDNKEKGLNWRVTIKRNGKAILTTDYGAGCGHCPAYKNAKGSKSSIYNDNRINTECEKGFAVAENSEYTTDRTKPICPDECDVMNSLLLDSQVLDSPSFEDWASELGYDTDSRKAEKIYQQCMQIALQLKAGLGWEVIGLLNQAFENY